MATTKKTTKITFNSLIAEISSKTGIGQKIVKTVVKALQKHITSNLRAEGDKAYIKDLGKFEIKKRKGKIDYLSGKPIKRPDKLHVTFVPSKGKEAWDI